MWHVVRVGGLKQEWDEIRRRHDDDVRISFTNAAVNGVDGGFGRGPGGVTVDCEVCQGSVSGFVGWD
ncbi:hypothetical protein SAMN04488067_104261 [Halorubrum xinjiangense]|uniref:Uncharacterized protein n=1 Tax=Halorubrum xinjiangense TaxID=261291 RepID=A0A1G7L9B6_9EURY|nr:hypothetical protein SAMN04488067_104261 [Halorubrum xinjiangense]